MTAVARALRLDDATWSRFAVAGRTQAALVAGAAYALLAFDRLGVQGVLAPRATVRMLLAGFYGWAFLAAGSWLVARYAAGAGTRAGSVFWLYGRAHLPLLLLAVVIQVAAVFLRVLGPGLWAGVFVIAFWMPAMLVGAARTAFGVGVGTAIVIVAGPYLVWVAVVGNYLRDQLGHLL